MDFKQYRRRRDKYDVEYDTGKKKKGHLRQDGTERQRARDFRSSGNNAFQKQSERGPQDWTQSARGFRGRGRGGKSRGHSGPPRKRIKIV